MFVRESAETVEMEIAQEMCVKEDNQLFSWLYWLSSPTFIHPLVPLEDFLKRHWLSHVLENFTELFILSPYDKLLQ